MVSIKECTDNKLWNGFLEREKNNQMVTIAHNPCLGPILAKTFGYSFTNYLVKEDNEIIGVLPTVNVGGKIVSMPHFSYGGPIINAENYQNLNFSELLNVSKFEVRSLLRLSQHYTDEKISCVLNLQNTEDEMIMTIQSKLRQKIRKCLRLDFKVVSGGIELLHDFYDVFSRRMLKFGSPPLGKQFFRNLLENYENGDVQITVIYDGEKAISAGFSLSYLGFNELCWSGTEGEYNKKNVNALLFWEMIKTSIDKGHCYYSFGRSTKESPQHFFKKLWNPMELPIYYNLSEKPSTSIKDFDFLTKIWKYQPLKTSQILGHYVSKFVY
ncbi:GNAT family N-acetyltransferase [Maribacter sp. X9]|uniref:GNAT family N-acetyltransferase n=1 Tax=Maribacter sp. X9 TaxID=3402159 RepID=UPI003AF34125